MRPWLGHATEPCVHPPCLARSQSLALAHTTVDDSGNVLLSGWTETDFRTGEAPWWK